MINSNELKTLIRSMLEGETYMAGYSKSDSVTNNKKNNESASEMFDDGCDKLEDASKEQLLSLLETVETNIIPKLVSTHRNAEGSAAKTNVTTSPQNNEEVDEQVKEFTRILMQSDIRLATSYVEKLKQKDISVDTIYLDLFAPVAKYLGYMWEKDMCSFTEVTIGVGRLQELLRELSLNARYQSLQADTNKRILLTPIPGEQHTFGMSMLIEFFNRAGWEVWGWPGISEKNLIPLVKKEWFQIIGISMYAEIHEEQLISTINAIRRYSRNPSVNIMVGGYAFESNPDLISEVGADAFTKDANEALLQAEQLFETQ